MSRTNPLDIFFEQALRRRAKTSKIQSYDESSNMQVHAPPEPLPMDSVMPDAAVPSQPFQAKEALMLRPHYLGKEKRYPVTSSAPEFLSWKEIGRNLKEEFSHGISQYLRDGVYAVPVAELETLEMAEITNPDDFYVSEDGDIKLKQIEGPDEIWVSADISELRIMVQENLNILLAPLRKQAEEVGADLEVERLQSDFIVWLIFDESSLDEMKRLAGLVSSETEDDDFKKLNLQSGKEFWPSYGGQVKLLAEEHGIGDILGFSFRPDCIEIIGVEKIMDLDYELKLLQSREIYSIQGEI